MSTHTLPPPPLSDVKGQTGTMWVLVLSHHRRATRRKPMPGGGGSYCLCGRAAMQKQKNAGAKWSNHNNRNRRQGHARATGKAARCRKGCARVWQDWGAEGKRVQVVGDLAPTTANPNKHPTLGATVLWCCSPHPANGNPGLPNAGAWGATRIQISPHCFSRAQARRAAGPPPRWGWAEGDVARNRHPTERTRKKKGTPKKEPTPHCGCTQAPQTTHVPAVPPRHQRQRCR